MHERAAYTIMTQEALEIEEQAEEAHGHGSAWTGEVHGSKVLLRSYFWHWKCLELHAASADEQCCPVGGCAAHSVSRCFVLGDPYKAVIMRDSDFC